VSLLTDEELIAPYRSDMPILPVSVSKYICKLVSESGDKTNWGYFLEPSPNRFLVTFTSDA